VKDVPTKRETYWNAKWLDLHSGGELLTKKERALQKRRSHGLSPDGPKAEQKRGKDRTKNSQNHNKTTAYPGTPSSREKRKSLGGKGIN